MGAQRKPYINRITDIFLLFMVGAGIGWIYEVVLHLLQNGVFVNRGMLHGPWLPIYGTGCLLMVGLKRLIGKRPVVYFIGCVAASAVLEYVTSFVLEAVYHTRWWDYSNLPWNLNGRIFFGGLIGFGLAGCLFAYLLLPAMEKIRSKIPLRTKKALTIMLAVIFLADVLISLLLPNIGAGITHP